MQKCMIYSLMAVALMLVSANRAAAVVVLSEDFEGTGNTLFGSPQNTDNVGDWLYPQTGIEIHTDQVTSGSLGARYMDFPGTYTVQHGYIQNTSTVSNVGDTVHAELQMYYNSGLYIVFGIAADATSTTQESDALLYLRFQSQSGSFSTVLQTMNSSGNFVDVGDGTVQLTTNDFDKIEFDYVVGDSTGVLSIDGVVVDSSVALRNPGAAVDGMFFLQDNSDASSNVRYWIDDLQIDYTPVPEPASMSLMLLASGIVLSAAGRRPRK